MSLGTIIAYSDRIVELERQLAAMTAERDDLLASLETIAESDSHDSSAIKRWAKIQADKARKQIVMEAK